MFSQLDQTLPIISEKLLFKNKGGATKKKYYDLCYNNSLITSQDYKLLPTVPIFIMFDKITVSQNRKNIYRKWTKLHCKKIIVFIMIYIIAYNIMNILPFNMYWAIFIVTSCIPDFIELYRLCIAMHPLLNQWWQQCCCSYYSCHWSIQKCTHNYCIYVCYCCTITITCQPVGDRVSKNFTTQRMRRKFLQVCSNTLPICQPSCCLFHWGLKYVLCIVLLPLSTMFWIIGCCVMRKMCIHIMFAEIV